MSAIDSYSKRLAPAGSLIGISTIHFVRWLLHRRGPAADDGERLRRILGKLHRRVRRADPLRAGRDLGNLVWISSGRRRDLPAFKRFLRSHQVPSEVFYSAYPEETVLNIVNDRAFARACVGQSVRPSVVRPAAAVVSAMMPRSARLTDDVLADIQGFITSGYGHLSRAAYLFVQFHDAGRARRWLRRLTPAITSARPWPIAPRRRENQAAGGDEHRLQPPTVSPLSVCHRECLCTFPPSSRKGSRTRTDRESSEIQRRAIPSNGNWAEQVSRRSMRSLSFMRRRRKGSRPRATRNARSCDDTAGGVVELPGSMQSGYRPDGDHEPFGFHDGIAQPSIAGITGDGVPTGEFILGYQNHYQIVPPTPVVPAELDRRRESCLRWPTPITRRTGCAISASTAPTSYIESSSRTSQGSGSS